MPEPARPAPPSTPSPQSASARFSGDLARRGFTFTTASTLLVCYFIFSSAPIPLIGVWAGELGLTTAEVAMTVVSYFFGCILTLVFFARLSNALGRKWTALITIAWAAASCWCYAVMDSALLFNLARFMQGLACGLASSAAMAWIVDSAPKGRAWLGTGLAAAGPNIGLSLGTLLSGVLTTLGWVTDEAIFFAFVGVCVLLALAVRRADETIPKGMESLGEVLKPKLALPKRLLRIFMLPAFSLLGTWGLGSFLQGFSATLAADAFESTSTLLAAVVYLGLIVPNAAAGIAVGRLSPARWFPVAVTVFFLAGSAIFLFLKLGIPSLFLLSLIVSGAASGSTCTLGMKLLLQDAALKERAGVIASLYLSCYVGAGIPNFVVSRLTAGVSMSEIYLGYVLWMAASWALSIAAYLVVRASDRPAERLRFEELAGAPGRSRT